VTHFHGPLGIDGDAMRWAVYTGSPFWYIGYLAVLCVIGVLFALLRDEESERRRVVRALVIAGVVALALLTLTMTGGYDELMHNPLPSGRE
jgi:predicted MFS family arabinose efflux permease